MTIRFLSYLTKYLLNTLVRACVCVLPDDGGLPPKHVGGIQKLYLRVKVFFFLKEVIPLPCQKSSWLS